MTAELLSTRRVWRITDRQDPVSGVDSECNLRCLRPGRLMVQEFHDSGTVVVIVEGREPGTRHGKYAAIHVDLTTCPAWILELVGQVVDLSELVADREIRAEATALHTSFADIGGGVS